MRFQIIGRTIQGGYNTMLGLQGDNKVERVEFALPKMYNDVDLSEGIAYVLFSTASKQEGYVPGIEKTVVGDDIILTWLVGSQVTAEPGMLHIALKISGLDAVLWNSEISMFYVGRSIQVESPQEPALRSSKARIASPDSQPPSNEPPITVSERKIIIPPVLQNIAVQNDENSESVLWKLPRHFDGHDLSIMRIYLKTIMPEDGGRDDLLWTNPTVTKDEITWWWTLRPPQTSFSGNVTLQIVVLGTRSDGLPFEWKTDGMTTINIMRSPDAEPVIPSTPSVMDDFLKQISAIAAKAETSETNAKTSETNADASAKAAKAAVDSIGTSVEDAAASAAAAKISESNAKSAETASKKSETNSKAEADRAKTEADRASSIVTGNLGFYATPEALKVAHPTGEDGWYAFVGTTDTVWVWDSDTKAWKDSGTGARVDAFIECTATYNATTKLHTLIPVQNKIPMPEVFTVRFKATADFKAGDKVYLDKVEYTPAYTDSSDAVDAGTWLLNTVVNLTCSTVAKKAFVGIGRNSALEKKVNQDWVETQLDAKMHYLGQIEDRNLLEWLDTQPSGWFVVAGPNSGIPIATYYYGKWFRGPAPYRDGTCELTAVVYNWKYTINKINGVWETKFREDPTMDSGTWTPSLVNYNYGNPVVQPIVEYTERGGVWSITGNQLYLSCNIGGKITNPGSGIGAVGGFPRLSSGLIAVGSGSFRDSCVTNPNAAAAILNQPLAILTRNEGVSCTFKATTSFTIQFSLIMGT